MELRGHPCIEFEGCVPAQKNMVISRSFGDKTKEYNILKKYICLFTERAGEKLRVKGLKASEFGIFVRTSAFHKENHYSNFKIIPLGEYTNNTRILLKAAYKALKIIFKKDHLYMKAGICLLDLTNCITQKSLFTRAVLEEKPELMKAFDQINKKYGKSTILIGHHIETNRHILSQIPKRERLSPRYTTYWSDISIVV